MASSHRLASMPPRSATSQPVSSSSPVTVALAAGSFPATNIVGGPPGRSGSTISALPTVL